MAKTREITLNEENWKKIEKLVSRIPDSEFLKFCLMNDIVELGLDRFEELITMNQQASHERIKIRIAY